MKTGGVQSDVAASADAAFSPAGGLEVFGFVFEILRDEFVHLVFKELQNGGRVANDFFESLRISKHENFYEVKLSAVRNHLPKVLLK